MKKRIINPIILLASVLLIFSVLSSCKKVGAELVEETIEETAEYGVKQGARKGTRKFFKEVAERSIKDASSDIAARRLYEQFQKHISKEFADGVVVRTSKEGIEYVSKEFPTSAIRKNGNVIVGKAGSLIDNGPVNEFFNHLLPNSKYVVDDVFIYETDKLGRVVSCSADRTKAFVNLAGKRNPQRNSNVQKMVVEKLDGKVGFDDAGHLFSNTSGGANELINQVPMNADLNRNGLWRQLERTEEEALQQGKQVYSYRKLLYDGDSKRPYAIEFISEIDGVINKTIVKNN